MTLQEFANLAEIVGAFAVVVSLVYLAIQVRQNTVQMRENSKIARLLLQENFVSGQETFFRTMLENENAHRVWDLGYSANEEIPSEKDRELFGFILYGQMYRYHVMYQARVVEPLEHERSLLQIDRLASRFAFRSWWSRHKSSFSFDSEFVELVDSRIAKTDVDPHFGND